MTAQIPPYSLPTLTTSVPNAQCCCSLQAEKITKNCDATATVNTTRSVVQLLWFSHQTDCGDLDMQDSQLYMTRSLKCMPHTVVMQQCPVLDIYSRAEPANEEKRWPHISLPLLLELHLKWSCPICSTKGDHSPGIVKFPLTFPALLPIVEFIRVKVLLPVLPDAKKVSTKKFPIIA